ncbi:hypothetical protein ACJA88_013646 [Fusarium oxysporum]
MAAANTETVSAAEVGVSAQVDSEVGVMGASPEFTAYSRYLVKSPYTEQEHLLDLESLDNENALFARALSRLRVLREDYATAPYTEAFNWIEVIEELKRLAVKSEEGFKETSFYIVLSGHVSRSQQNTLISAALIKRHTLRLWREAVS